MADNLKWYVYALLTRSEEGEESIFYVGKGIGNRFAAHLDEWRSYARDLGAADGNSARLASAKLKAIDAVGVQNVKVRVLARDIETEKAAYSAETAAINALDPDLTFLTNRVHGHGEASMVYDAAPVELDPSHRLLLVKVDVKFKGDRRDVKFRHMASPSSSMIYQKTRKWWPIASARIRLWGAEPDKAPTHVLGIFHGVAMGVYRLDEKRWRRLKREENGKYVLPTIQGTTEVRDEDEVVQRYLNRTIVAPDGESLFRYRVSGVRYWNLE